MSAGELETLSRLKIPAALIHFNNGCFGWIKALQALQALHCQQKYFSVDFTVGQPSLVAEGFGLPAFQIENADDLEQHLEEAFAGEGPVFLVVKTTSEATEFPPVFSWLKKAERMERTMR